jgi:antitoxin component of RelBE/YafQ-DinJ toxin-antitoxin module
MLMKKKLTLTIEGSVKERAKKYASRHDTSISDMVEQYLSKTATEDEFTPEPESWTALLYGSAKLSSKYKNLSYKEIKEKELQKKYGQ